MNLARFHGVFGGCAWRPFVLDIALGRGTHRLASRATTVDGVRQPALVAPSHGGYGHDGWRDHAVEVTLSRAFGMPFSRAGPI